MEFLKNKSNWIEIAGWLGALIIILAYFFVSFGIMKAESIPYQSLNLLGAGGIIAISAYKKVFQSVILNIFWGLIATIAIINILF